MTIPGAYAESVPNWVKNTAGWWATDAISEDEFVNAIEFLVNEGILVVESTNSSKTNESKIIDNFYGDRFNFENSVLAFLRASLDIPAFEMSSSNWDISSPSSLMSPNSF